MAKYTWGDATNWRSWDTWEITHSSWNHAQVAMDRVGGAPAIVYSEAMGSTYYLAKATGSPELVLPRDDDFRVASTDGTVYLATAAGSYVKRYPTGTWSAVERFATVSGPVALAVEGATAHVAFREGGTLFHKWRLASGAWGSEAVATGVGSTEVAIATSPGSVQVAYVDEVGRRIVVATRRSSGWEFETAHSWPYPELSPSSVAIAVTSTGATHASFANGRGVTTFAARGPCW